MRKIAQGCVAILLCLSSAVQAGENCYKLRPVVIDGKARPIEPVCRALAKNLNRFCGQPPMVCGLKIHSDYRHLFRLPEWKSVPPDLERIEAFIRGPWMPDSAESAWIEDGPKIKAALAENRLRFAEANVDIYNLGKKQPAYRLDLGDCEAIAKILGPGDPLSFNINWIQHSPEVIKELFSRNFLISDVLRNGDVFVFRGKTYNAGMTGYVLPATGMPQNFFWVNHRERNRRLEVDRSRLILDSVNVCHIEYHPRKENAK